jgi:hypothetical protein
VLSAACAGLLVAAGIALLVSGGTTGGGSTTAPDGVFTGGPGAGSDGGTGPGGTGPGGTGVATESAQSPAPGLPPVARAGNGAARAGADLTGVGGDGPLPANRGGPAAGGQDTGDPGGSTAAGAPTRAGGGTGPGTAPAEDAGTGPNQRPDQDPDRDSGTTSEDDTTSRPPEEGTGDCGCPDSSLDPVTEVVEEVVGITDPVGETAGALLP